MQWARRAYCLDSRALRRSWGKNIIPWCCVWLLITFPETNMETKRNLGRSNSCAKGWFSASVINFQGWTSGLKVTSQKHRSTPQLYQYLSQKILMEDFECLWCRCMYSDCIMYIIKEIRLATTGIQLIYIILLWRVVQLQLSLPVLSCQDRSSECGEGRCSRSSSDICQSYWHMVKWRGDRWQKISQDSWSIQVCLMFSDFQCFGSMLVFQLGEWVRPALISFFFVHQIVRDSERLPQCWWQDFDSDFILRCDSQPKLRPKIGRPRTPC